MINRQLDLKTYNSSVFLLGPRQTGKTYLIKHTLLPDIYINLLKEEAFLRYSKDLSLLSKEVNALKKEGPIQVVIDEIQRRPELLNEVHSMIEERPGTQFILTGSSARKLRKGGVNLLGGRAVTAHLYPFTHIELGERFQLADALHFGTLPKVALEINEKNRCRLLKSYVETYLKEEIQQEAITRSLSAFARFLELAAFENGNILNFNNMSREVGVSAKIIKEYFQILEDTLIGFYLYPFTKSHREKLVLHPKFYFFDTGVVTALRNGLGGSLIEGTPPYGNAFEHFLLLELKRILDYAEIEYALSFFRTSDGAEVDVILEINKEIWAIEIKSGSQPSGTDIRGLKSFISDHKFARALCVCQTPRRYALDKVEVVNWQDFLASFTKIDEPVRLK